MATLTVEQKETLMLRAKSAGGTVVPVPIPVVWSVGDPAVATVEAAEDGLSAVLRAVTPGSTSISVSANGLGASLSVSVIPAPAAVLEIVEGTPVAQ
jgi:hypothetical protein